MNEINSFRGKYMFLSNFYACSVTCDGITYPSSEAAFQAYKTLDVNERLKFTQMSPIVAKRAGKTVPLRSDWQDVKIQLMLSILFAKFTQNEDLKQLLIDTGDSLLVEGNTWHDYFWGVCDGQGKNYLGKCLMSVRETLRNG